MVLSSEELTILDRMSDTTSVDVTNEEFATRTVGLLIHCKGNLNKYEKTLEIAFELHERIIRKRYGV